jgi:hypothetical protein
LTKAARQAAQSAIHYFLATAESTNNKATLLNAEAQHYFFYES